jgi:hypothetical protein
MTTAVSLVTGVSGAGVGFQPPGSNSNNTPATTAFVNNQIAYFHATLPLSGVTGGVYNQASLGSGCTFAILSSGGVITGIATIVSGGANYVVGDMLVAQSGNYDAVVRVTSVNSGSVLTLAVVYGGTGYTNGLQATANQIPPGSRFVPIFGALTSNMTIIIANGPSLTFSRSPIFANNTSGAFTVTVLLSNGAGGTVGTGVVLTQGSNNSTAQLVVTDGQSDVWKVA